MGCGQWRQAALARGVQRQSPGAPPSQGGRRTDAPVSNQPQPAAVLQRPFASDSPSTVHARSASIREKFASAFVWPTSCLNFSLTRQNARCERGPIPPHQFTPAIL